MKLRSSTLGLLAVAGLSLEALTTTASAALLIGGLLTAAVPVLARQDTETVNRTVPFPDRGTLKLNNFSGRVTIVGTTGRDVIIKATRRADRERLDHIKMDVRTEGSTVVVDANKRDSGWDDRQNNVVESDIDIQVPASAALKIDCFSCPVDVRGVAGDQTLHTFSGEIKVNDAKAAMKLETFSGDLDVDLVNAGAAPEVRAKTFSGDMRLRIAADAKGDVTVSGNRGSFESDMPLVMSSTGRNRNIKATLPGGWASGNSHGIEFETFSGHIRIVK